jgi:hypothetical protein
MFGPQIPPLPEQHTAPSLRQSNPGVRQRFFFVALHGRLSYYLDR